MMFIIAILAILAADAKAAVEIHEHLNKVTYDISEIEVQCTPGVVSDQPRHSRPSIIHIFMQNDFSHFTNVLKISHEDVRVGDYCSELMEELQSPLPNVLELTRDISENASYKNGFCTRIFTEELVGTISGKRFLGIQNFAAEHLSSEHCPTLSPNTIKGKK